MPRDSWQETVDRCYLTFDRNHVTHDQWGYNAMGNKKCSLEWFSRMMEHSRYLLRFNWCQFSAPAASVWSNKAFSFHVLIWWLLFQCYIFCSIDYNYKYRIFGIQKLFQHILPTILDYLHTFITKIKFCLWLRYMNKMLCRFYSW